MTVVASVKLSNTYSPLSFSVSELPREVLSVTRGERREVQQRRHREGPRKDLQRC